MLNGETSETRRGTEEAGLKSRELSHANRTEEEERQSALRYTAAQTNGRMTLEQNLKDDGTSFEPDVEACALVRS